MNNFNEYEQQAIDFLTTTDTVLRVEFKKFGSMPWDKSAERNIFTCELSNSKYSYVFDFGSSIMDSCDTIAKPITEVKDKIGVYVGLASSSRKGISGSVKFSLLKEHDFKLTVSGIEDLANNMVDDYNNSIKDYNKKLRVNKFEGNGLKLHEAVAHINKKITEKLKETEEVYVKSKKIIPPTNYDILSCLQVDYSEDFEDFCANFGYDNDSIKALNIYEAVKKESEALQQLFTEEQLEQLHEIQ